MTENILREILPDKYSGEYSEDPIGRYWRFKSMCHLFISSFGRFHISIYSYLFLFYSHYYMIG